MGSRRGIYNDIAATTSDFFHPPQKKNSLGQGRALGNFFSLGLKKKKNLGFGAISLYIALRDPIYTLHIYHFRGYIQTYIFTSKSPYDTDLLNVHIYISNWGMHPGV